jgi:hypothetical protein
MWPYSVLVEAPKGVLMGILRGELALLMPDAQSVAKEE